MATVYVHWTPAMKEQALRLRNQGFTLEHIGRTMGLSFGSVASQLRRLQDPVRYAQERPRATACYEEMAGATVAAATRSGQPWCTWEDELVLEHGASLTELAELLERTYRSVATRRWLLREGLV